MDVAFASTIPSPSVLTHLLRASTWVSGAPTIQPTVDGTVITAEMIVTEGGMIVNGTMIDMIVVTREEIVTIVEIGNGGTVVRPRAIAAATHPAGVVHLVAPRVEAVQDGTKRHLVGEERSGRRKAQYGHGLM